MPIGRFCTAYGLLRSKNGDSPLAIRAPIQPFGLFLVLAGMAQRPDEPNGRAWRSILPSQQPVRRYAQSGGDSFDSIDGGGLFGAFDLSNVIARQPGALAQRLLTDAQGGTGDADIAR